MPGFIQSIKSRLPQSPFSPPKQSAPVLPLIDSAEPAEEVAQPAEQASAEILPAEALIAPNSSTVALTLTPVTGLSSQQTTDDLEVPETASALAEESAPELESSTRPEVAAPDVEVAPEAEPLAAVSPALEAEAPAILAPEVAEAAPAVPEVSEVETVVETISAEPLSASIPSELPTTSDSAQNTEEVLSEPATPIESVKPATLKYKKSITRKEPPVYIPAALAEAVATPIVADDTVAVTPPIIQVEGVAADVEPIKEETSPAKEEKPKKKRFMMSPLKKSFSPNNSQDGNSTDDSAHAKPKKNQPLAGRFKQVLCQVKSKVKKDKDSDKSPAANTSDNAAPSDDAPSSDNGASSGAPTPSEELTASDVTAPMDAALPSGNAVTA